MWAIASVPRQGVWEFVPWKVSAIKNGGGAGTASTRGGFREWGVGTRNVKPLRVFQTFRGG